MEIQRRSKSYYWKRVQVLHGAKKSWMKLSLNLAWGRTAALTGLRRSTAHKIVDTGRAATAKATSVIYVESVTGWLWPGCCTEDHRQHVLLEAGSVNPWWHQNRAQTEYWLHWQQGSSSQRSPSYEVCLHTLWGESKSADGETRWSPQQDEIPSQGQEVERDSLHIGLNRWNLRSYQSRCPEMMAR